MKKTLIAALLATTCAFSTAASASVMKMDGAFGAGLMSNNTYSTVFNGQSFLPEQYTVNSLSFSFTFLDDGSDNWKSSTTSSKTVGGYKPHPWTNWKYRDVAVTNTTTRTYDQESAMLSFGGLVLGSGSTSLDSSSKTTGTHSGLVYDGYGCTQQRTSKNCTYYKSLVTTTDILVTNDYKGGFTIAGIVSDQSIIDQLLNHGSLALNLKVGGDLLLTGGQVLLDYTTVELPAEVPEPSSVLLAGLGLAAIGFARRRVSAAPRSA